MNFKNLKICIWGTGIVGISALNFFKKRELKALRNFFSYSIEKESFVCFNYRHRPHSSGRFNMCICKVKSCKFDEIINLYDKKNWIDSRGHLLALKCQIIKIKINSNENASTDLETSQQLTEKDIGNLLEFKKLLKWMPNGNVGK